MAKKNRGNRKNLFDRPLYDPPPDPAEWVDDCEPAAPQFESILHSGAHTTPQAERYAKVFERAAERNRQQPPSLKKVRSSKAGDAIRRIDASRFCRVCGSRFVRQPDERQANWAQRDKCDKCRAMKLKSKADHRYCRHCGTLVTDSGLSNICADCTDASKNAHERAETAMREAQKLAAPHK